MLLAEGHLMYYGKADQVRRRVWSCSKGCVLEGSCQV